MGRGAGAEMRIKASPRERERAGGGDLASQGIDLRAPGSNTGETVLIQATAEPTYILHSHIL